METKELLEAIRSIVKEETQDIKKDVQDIKDRTLKLEVTIENETNRNIKLLMEAQSLNTEKLKEIATNSNRIDKLETGLFAVTESTKQNKEEIEKLKIKIG